MATVPIEKVGQLKVWQRRDDSTPARPPRSWVGDEESFNLLLSENHPAHLNSFPQLLSPVFNFANDVVDVALIVAASTAAEKAASGAGNVYTAFLLVNVATASAFC
jgi:hypothetical protein